MNAHAIVALFIVVGLILFSTIALLLSGSLKTVAVQSNLIEQRQTTNLVKSALRELVEYVSILARDNAVWNDAFEKVYAEPLDELWLRDTWAAQTTGMAYDGAIVFDENWGAIWGNVKEQNVTGRDDTLSSVDFGGIKAAFQDALHNPYSPVAGIVRTRFGLAAVAVSQVLPSTNTIGLPKVSIRYLAFMQLLTEKRLSGLSKVYNIDGLQLITANSDQTAMLPVENKNGQQVAGLNWTVRLPGEEASMAVWPQVRTALLIVGGIILLLTFLTAFGVRRLLASKERERMIALRDSLSGLPNRRALMQLLSESDAERNRALREILYLDLDGFKSVNDNHGHAVGDTLIRQVAERLGDVLPPGAVLCRLGGDEFAILTSHIRVEGASNGLARQMLDRLSEPFRIGEISLSIGASIGIAWEMSPLPGQELLRQADIAMYEAKSNGRDCIMQYSDELDMRRNEHQRIESELRSGLENAEFDVVYQPIVESESHRTTAVEALVRWPRRPAGPLPPDSFIHIAEKSGLINQLGLFVMSRACRDLLPFPWLMLSVNVSPAQFRDIEFDQKLAAVLADTGFPPERLQVEITETYLVESPERAGAVIASLRALGIKIALDDFGAGYSSIGSLRRFAVDRIKIDRSLAGLVDTDRQAAALVAATMAIASALDITVTAEGVETKAQALLLRIAGCQTLQGYYFGRPDILARLPGAIIAQDTRLTA
jgi:diguanylate cyclase (GGDEF)-like protein